MPWVDITNISIAALAILTMGVVIKYLHESIEKLLNLIGNHLHEDAESKLELAKSLTYLGDTINFLREHWKDATNGEKHGGTAK